MDSIDIATPAGLRDRALMGLMVYSFARIGAALGMRVEDAFTQRRRLWVRLREKGGKQHEMPCHPTLEAYLRDYIEGTGRLTRTVLSQVNSYAMVQRRTEAADIGTRIANQIFRAS